MTGGGKLAHVQPDLGEHDLGCLDADTWNLVESGDRGERLIARCTGGVVVRTGVRGWLGCGDLGDQLVDSGGQVIDLGGQRVDLVQQQTGQFDVMRACHKFCVSQR